MNIQTTPDKKLFVLDTNVLMHDPACIFRFQEHDIFIPMIVLEELDRAKRGMTEVARNVRQASRFLDELIRDVNPEHIKDGLPLSRLEANGGGGGVIGRAGRLYFQTSIMSELLPETMPGSLADNSILSVVLALTRQLPGIKVILVSKDINMRLKAATLELPAEDYHNDQVLDDIELLYSGAMALEDDFWDRYGSKMDSWQEKGRTFYKLENPLVAEWYPNQYLYMEDDSNFEAIVRSCDGRAAILELARDYRTKDRKSVV